VSTQRSTIFDLVDWTTEYGNDFGYEVVDHTDNTINLIVNGKKVKVTVEVEDE
jgi:hypothetical protein